VDEHVAPFHIQASPEVAGIPKLVLKHEESFFVSDRSGDFPAHFEGELGFYHAGTRHLRWLELRLNGQRPLRLTAEVAPANTEIRIALTNADLHADGATIPRNTIYIGRLLSLGDDALQQAFSIASHHDTTCTLQFELIFTADFHDVFEVRGMHRAARGETLPAVRDGAGVRLAYRGLDGVVRTTRIAFEPAPDVVAANRAVWTLALAPGVATRIVLTATAGSGDDPPPIPAAHGRGTRLAEQATLIETDNPAFNALLERSLRDLDMLLTETPAGIVPYAGVPWYVAPFGRDSIVTALQLLPYQAGVAEGTLRFLASWQGRALDAFRDEEPGKILHEYRRGEMANCREIPFIPYYGTIDATPLFVVLLAEYARWTGDLRLVRDLWPAVQAAMAWMRMHGDRDGDGYLEYATRSPLGLGNQGWKDSEDAVSHADGRLAALPIALVEVQGYAYAALRGAAELADLLGEPTTAAAWRTEAATLRERFNRDFWLEAEGTYALALDGDKRPCEVVASNAAHALWTGIVDDDRAAVMAKRLLADDMFSGWGIRTLSVRERRYNPMSYHNGSVWPHDNAIAAAGFRRYRLPGAAESVAGSLFDASRHFEQARMPELFCGFTRQAGYGPISYPVACAPQAWAAGSVFQVLTALIGMDPDALARRITFQTPVLPPWLRWIELHGLKVGSTSFDLAVSRGRDSASVELIARRGDAELIVRR
jgi:glycogen debranching enzyme